MSNIHRQLAAQFERSYDRDFDAASDYSDDVQEMEDNLLDGEYNPAHIDNIVECLNDLSFRNDIRCKSVEAAFESQDTALAGEIMAALCFEYWQMKAAADAPSKLAEQRQCARDEYLAGRDAA